MLSSLKEKFFFSKLKIVKENDDPVVEIPIILETITTQGDEMRQTITSLQKRINDLEANLAHLDNRVVFLEKYCDAEVMDFQAYIEQVQDESKTPCRM